MGGSSDGSVKYNITADYSEFMASLKKVNTAIEDFQKAVGKSSSQTGEKLGEDMTAGAKTAGKAVDSLADQSISALSSISKSIGQIAWGTFTTGALAATTSLTSFAKSAIQGADWLETQQVSMGGLLGTMDAGNKAMATAANYWMNNPFQRTDVTAATKQLVQYGRTLDQLNGDLETLGNVSLATQVPIDELARLYGRTASSGRAMTMDLEMMADRGIPIYSKLSEITGKTQDGIREMARNGKIDFALFEKAMKAAVSPEAMEAFENTMARQTDRVKGSFSILKGALSGYRVEMDETGKVAKGLVFEETGLLKATTRLMKVFATGLRSKEMTTAFTNLGNALVPFIDKLTEKLPDILTKVGKAMEFVSKHAGMLIPIVGGAAIAFGQLLSGLPGIGGVLGNLSGGIKSLITGEGGKGGLMGLIKVNPLLAAFIGFMSVGLVKAFQGNEEFRKSVMDLMKALGALGQTLMKAFQPLVEGFVNLAGSGAVTGVITSIVKALTLLVNVLNKIPEPVLTGLIVAITGLLVARKVVGPIKELGGGLAGLASIAKSFTSMKGLSNFFGSMFGGGGIATGAETMAKSAKKTAASLSKGQTAMKTVQMGMGNLILMAAAIAALAGALWVAYKAIPDDWYGLAKKLTMLGGAVLGMEALAVIAGKIKSTRAGILNLIGIAAAIAALAGALWIVDKAIPNDLSGLIQKLAVLSGAVVAIGGLSFVAGLLKGNIIPGLFVLVGIAGVLAIVAAAVKYANSALPSDVGDFAKKVASLAIGVAAVGVLAGVLGAIMMTGVGAAILVAGLLAMTAICGAMIVAAKAIDEVNKKVPEDIGKVKDKIKNIGEVVKYISTISTGGLFSNFKNSLNAGSISGVVKAYADIAVALNKIQSIELNPEAIKNKIILISTIMHLVADSGGESIGSMISSIAKQFLAKVDIGIVAQVVKTYYDVAETLNKLQSIELNPAAIYGKLAILKQVISYVADPGDKGIGSMIAQTAKQFLAMVDTALIGKVVDTYYTVAKQLNEIQGIELDIGMIQVKLNLLKKCIDLVAYNGDEGFWQILSRASKQALDAKATENAGKVVQTYASVIDALKKIEQEVTFNPSDLEKKISDLGKIMKVVFDTKGSGGLFGAVGSFFSGKSITEDQVSTVVSIVKKMAEISKALNGMEGVNPGNVDKIESISNCISKINNVKSIKDIGGIEHTVNMAVAIVYKMQEVVVGMNKLSGPKPDTAAILESIANALNKVDLIKNIKDIGAKEHMVGMATSIIYKFMELVKVMNQLEGPKSSVVAAIESITNSMSKLSGIDVLKDIGAKEHMIGMSTSIAYKMKEFVGAANQLEGPKSDTVAIIDSIKNCLNKISDIKTVDDIGAKEYTVAASISIVNKLNELTKVLNTLSGPKPETVSIIQSIGNCINKISDINVKEIGEIANTVSTSVSIVGKMKELVGVLNTLQGPKPEVAEIIKSIQNCISKIVNVPFAGDIGNKEFVVNMSMSIVYKMRELSSVLNTLQGPRPETISNIQSIQNCIRSIVDIQVAGDIGDKEHMVGMAMSIVYKMTELSRVLNSLQGPKPDTIPILQSIQNCIRQISYSPTMSDMGEKEWTTNMAMSILYKYTEFARVLNSLTKPSPEAETNLSGIQSSITKIAFYSPVGSELGEKEWTVNMAMSILYKMREFVGVLNTLPAVAEVALINVDLAKTGLTRILDISGDSAAATEKLAVISVAIDIANKLREFAGIISTLPAITPETTAGLVSLIQTMGQMVNAVISTISGQSQQLYNVGFSFGTKLTEGWNTALIPEKMKETISTALNSLGQMGPLFFTTGASFANALGNAFRSARDWNGDGFHVGYWMAQGVINGLKSRQFEVNSAAAQLSTSASKAMADAVKVKSPSRVTYAIGEFIGEGLAQGMLSQISNVQSSSEQLANAIAKPFETLKSMDVNVSGNAQVSGSPASSGATKDGITMYNTFNTEADVDKLARDMYWEYLKA